MQGFDKVDFELVMRAALQAADLGTKAGQSPFGAAIVDAAGEIVSCQHNRVKQLVDPSAHAEILAIREACRCRDSRDLSQFAIVATCEPCPMCAAAIVFSGIRCVAFGASVSDAVDAGYTDLQLPSSLLFSQLDDEVQVHPRILHPQCRRLLLTNGPLSD